MSQSNACLKMANPSYFKYTSLKQVAELFGVNVNSKRARDYRVCKSLLSMVSLTNSHLCGAP